MGREILNTTHLIYLIVLGREYLHPFCWTLGPSCLWQSVGLAQQEMLKTFPGLAQCFALWSSRVTLRLSTHSIVCYSTQLFGGEFDDLDQASNLVCWRSLYPPHIWFILSYLVESTCIHFVEHWVRLVFGKRSVWLSRRCSKRFRVSLSVSCFGHHEWRSDFPPTPLHLSRYVFSRNLN